MKTSNEIGQVRRNQQLNDRRRTQGQFQNDMECVNEQQPHQPQSSKEDERGQRSSNNTKKSQEQDGNPTTPNKHRTPQRSQEPSPKPTSNGTQKTSNNIGPSSSQDIPSSSTQSQHSLSPPSTSSCLAPTLNPPKDLTSKGKYSTPSPKIPSDKTSLRKLVDSKQAPQIFDSSPQGNTQAFSSRQHSLPPEIIAEEWNSSEGFEVGIFMTDTQHFFGDSYTPLLTTSTTKQKEALQHAKYISCGDGFDQDNLSLVLSTSTTRTFLATPLCTNIFDQDVEHNTYDHVLILFESVHDLASKQLLLKGKIFLSVLDASLCPADTIIWDYGPILQKFIRYLENICYIDTYKPYIHDNNNIFSSTPVKQATFNNTTGIMIITIDTSKTYCYQPPPRSRKDPATTRLRVDILKKQLYDGSRESACDFINKSLQSKLHEEASIASSTADFQRAAFQRRPSPISKHPKGDQDQEYFRFDIDCHSEGVEELATTPQQEHPLTSQCPTIIAFPFDLATHPDTFVATLRRGHPAAPRLELLNQLRSIPRMDEFLKFAIVRTKYSILFHVHSKCIPLPTNPEIGRLHWLNQLLWDARLVLLYPNGKYTFNPRFSKPLPNQKSTSSPLARPWSPKHQPQPPTFLLPKQRLSSAKLIKTFHSISGPCQLEHQSVTKSPIPTTTLQSSRMVKKSQGSIFLKVKTSISKKNNH